MIISIRHKGLRELFEKGKSAKIQQDHKNRLQMILTILNAATEIRDINFPGSGLHQLKGDLEGYWVIRVSGNWRLTFQFKEGDVLEVDYVDYH